MSYGPTTAAGTTTPTPTMDAGTTTPTPTTAAGTLAIGSVGLSSSCLIYV